jgi:molybdopterin-guanine dinucleotide biosynthesis protein A
MSVSPRSCLYGLVLAGGHSRRMGYDKAQLRHPDGRTLARRSYELLKEAGCAEAFLSLRFDQEIPHGCEHSPVLRDPPEESCGPLAGIVSAMRSWPGVDWLVVACDLPRLDLRTLTTLVAQRRENESFLAFRSSADGLPEPLCAIYGRDSRRVLEEALARDFRCPRKILIQQQCRLLNADDSRALENANTPSDWEQAIAFDG